MTANLLNTVLGLWLVYLAVLEPAWTTGDWKLPLAGLAVIGLALWARASDFRRWQSSVNIVLGAALLVLAAVHWEGIAPPLLLFWGVFWPGVLVAIFALWAALYRPGKAYESDAGEDEEHDRRGVGGSA